MARALAGALPAFRQVRWVASTGSTNADLLAQARDESAPRKPWLLGAHQQTSGRGRAGRPWQNRPGATLMFSCAFDVDVPAAVLASLSPLAGLVVCEALRRLAGPGADALRVKWPNDVQWRDAKLAGILVETTRNPAPDASGHAVVFGVGINLADGPALSQALQRQVADWQAVASMPGAPPSGPTELVCAVAGALHRALQGWQSGGFDAFVARYAQVDALAGQDVNVLDQGQVIQQGVAQGVDAQGRLVLATAGGLLPVTVGEVSVRAR